MTTAPMPKAVRAPSAGAPTVKASTPPSMRERPPTTWAPSESQGFAGAAWPVAWARARMAKLSWP